MSPAAPRPPRRRTVGATGERPPGVRELAARATQESILKAATRVFARHGFDGGRVEQISREAKSYDRMIYYYFGSKEQLFVAVIEDQYRRFNEAESKLGLEPAQPVESLRAVVRFMWTYYLRHPEFITLLNTENLHRGRHIAKSLRAREYSSPAVAVIGRVLASGAEQGLFRAEVPARDIYLMIAGMAYFYLSNRYTLSAFLGESLDSAEALAHWEGFLIDSVLRTVAAGDAASVAKSAAVPVAIKLPRGRRPVAAA